MNKLQFLLVVLLFTTISTCFAQQPSGRERISINKDWKFQKGDPSGMGDQLDYQNIKDWILPSGNDFVVPQNYKIMPAKVLEGGQYAELNFNDSGWRKLNVPHDWGIEGPFDINLPGETGKLPWTGIAWYRKTLDIPTTDKGKQIYLDIDGAMSNAVVWCNGQFAGGWPYGYASFRIDLTPFVKCGEKNIVAIRLQNKPESSRWYPGSGIYRNVWLVKTNPVHVAQYGTSVTTPSVNKDKASVNLKVTVCNKNSSDEEVTVKSRIFAMDQNDKLGVNSVAEIAASNVKVQANKSVTIEGNTSLTNPKLWDVNSPNQYAIVTTITKNGKVIDTYQTPLGFRFYEFTANDGFHLNGRRVQLYGVCQHHDLGALGNAMNLRALERQLLMLKEMGVNIIRTSHNPPTPEYVLLCDKIGIMVIDESFDMWERAKKPNGYSKIFKEWSEADQRALIRRDRNSPSVVMWSIGNEVEEQDALKSELVNGADGKTDYAKSVPVDGIAIANRLTKIAHEEDPTRPVTSCNNRWQTGFSGFQNTVDVFGYNYQLGSYKRFHETNPNLPFLGSETESTVSSRGMYDFPVSKKKTDGRMGAFQMSSYDWNTPGWGSCPDDEFKAQDENPASAGEIVWTGWDYLGEPTPFNTDATVLLNYNTPEAKAQAEKELKEFGKIKCPARSSYFGIIDLAGFKKDRFYIYQAHWRKDFPMAHILPHWNWAERVGQVTPIHVYTSGDAAELFLNGKSLGKKEKGKYEYRICWDDVKYEPGEVKVVAYKNGKIWAQDVVKTTDVPNKLLAQPDRNIIKANGDDLSFVTIRVADKNGLTNPRSMNKIEVSISGPGEIVATDNGDATDLTSFSSPSRNAFNGLLMVIVRSKAGQAGSIKLTAKSEGLVAGSTIIQSR